VAKSSALSAISLTFSLVDPNKFLKNPPIPLFFVFID
jgi:hypothetical protein